jgi:ABC-type sugar transport system permease subunit
MTPHFSRRKLQRSLIAYGFVGPAMILFAVFVLAPFLNTFYLSTVQWDGVGAKTSVGLRNYVEAFSDRDLGNAFVNNLVWVGFYVSVPILLGLFLALGLTRERVRGGNKLQVVYFIPHVLSTVVVVLIWKWIYSSRMGILSLLLQALHLVDGPYGLLGDPKYALYGLIAISVWRVYGFCTIVYVVGVQNIDTSLYDAARIDGANALQSFINVTLPGLASVTTFLVLLQVINTFQVFNYVFIATGGGPGNSTEVVSTLMYEQSFEMNEVGYGSAMAVILAFVLLGFGIMFINSREKKTASAE